MRTGRRLKSLQARLLAPLLGLLTVVWLGAAVMIWFDTSHELDELLDGHLAQAAALLVMQQTHAHEEDSVEDAPSLHKYAPKVVFQVFHEGRLVLSSANAGTVPISRKEQGFSTVRLTDDAQWRVFATRGAEHDVQVYVGEQTESRDSILLAVLVLFFRYVYAHQHILFYTSLDLRCLRLLVRYMRFCSAYIQIFYNLHSKNQTHPNQPQ